MIIVDMWDKHPCVNITSQMNELAPAINKFITKMADQGMTINQSVAFLNSCGLDSTEIAHATTFSYEDMAHLSFYRENL